MFVSSSDGPKNGSFTSPVIENNENHSRQCIYTFIAGENERVQLTFTSFNLRGAHPEYVPWHVLIHFPLCLLAILFVILCEKPFIANGSGITSCCSLVFPTHHSFTLLLFFPFFHSTGWQRWQSERGNSPRVSYFRFSCLIRLSLFIESAWMFSHLISHSVASGSSFLGLSMLYSFLQELFPVNSSSLSYILIHSYLCSWLLCLPTVFLASFLPSLNECLQRDMSSSPVR